MVTADGFDVGISHKFPENHLGNPVKFTDPDYTQPLLKELIEKIEAKNLPLIS